MTKEVLPPEVVQDVEKQPGIELSMSLSEAQGVGKNSSKEDAWSPDD